MLFACLQQQDVANELCDDAVLASMPFATENSRLCKSISTLCAHIRHQIGDGRETLGLCDLDSHLAIHH